MSSHQLLDANHPPVKVFVDDVRPTANQRGIAFNLFLSFGEADDSPSMIIRGMRVCRKKLLAPAVQSKKNRGFWYQIVYFDRNIALKILEAIKAHPNIELDPELETVIKPLLYTPENIEFLFPNAVVREDA